MAVSPELLASLGTLLDAAFGSVENPTDKKLKLEQLAQLKNRRQMSQVSFGMLPNLEQSLMTPVSGGELGAFASRLGRAAQPQMNRLAGSLASKFGSRSGLVGGGMSSAFNQYIAGPLADYYSMREQMRLGNKRTIYSTRAGLAG